MASSAPPSSSVIDLPPAASARSVPRRGARVPKRIMPFVYVHCPDGHVLRMSAEAISDGRECFCPHCRKAFRPLRTEVRRAGEHLDVGTRAKSPLPPIMAGATTARRTILPATWRIAARRAWRRLLRLFG
jgi:hypothetical protein